MTNIKAVVSKVIPGSLTDELEERIRRAALRNAEVRRMLGGRFAYIGIDEIEPDKRRRKNAEPLQTRVTFFSYTSNTAVEVLMKGLEVQSSAAQEEIPPEGADEVRQAVTFARKDARLIGRLSGLTEINGILVEIAQGNPGYGNRVIEVFFGRKNQDLPEYHALVDLTERKVIVAEALRRR